jgi:hypothetical protein
MVDRNLLFQFLAPEKTLLAKETGGAYSSLERLWRDNPDRLTYFEDQSLGTSAGGVQYFLRGEDSLKKFSAPRYSASVELYSAALALSRWTS